MKYTIKDIAELCQVGKSTVSRVLNCDPNVSPDTREKVQAVIDAIGFQPNRSARAMRGATEPVVGIIVSKLNASGEAETLGAILAELYQQHITPIIVESQFQAELVSHHFKLFKQRQVNAVILFGFSPLPESVVRQWKGSLVVIARQYPKTACVYYDDQLAITTLMACLYQQGHRHIGYLGIGDQDETTGRLRTQSYLDFCQTHQISPHFRLAELNAESGYVNCAMLFEQPLSALLCASSNLAIGALKYLQSRGLRVPIACIGRNTLLQYLAPDLISLDFGYAQAGKWAVELLLTQLAGHTEVQQRKVSFKSEFTIQKLQN